MCLWFLSSEGPLPPPTPPPRTLPPHRPLYENVSILTPPRNLQTTEAKDLEDKLYQTVVLESPPNSILFDHKGAVSTSTVNKIVFDWKLLQYG